MSDVERLQLHIKYIIALAATVLLAAIALSWGTNEDLTSRVGFASCGISIVLAIIAIFWAFKQGLETQRNISTMEKLIADASRIVTEKTGHIVEKVDWLREKMMQAPAEAAVSEKLPLIDAAEGDAGVDKGYDIANTSFAALETLYWIVKAHKSEKASTLKIFAETLEPSEISMHYAWGYCLGLNDGGTKFKLVAREDTLKAVQIPEDLEAEVNKEIDHFIREPKEREGLVELLKENLAKIDAYFD
jgi:hypothetical protein